MEFRSTAVMAYILSFCKTQVPPIHVSGTKAQKLLYCCYGAVLAAHDERLTNEHPRAWFYGPVFHSAFRAVKEEKLTVGMARQFARECPAETLQLIDSTLRTFGRYSADQLSAWVSMEDTPWAKADALASIDDREIAHFFRPYLPVIEKEDSSQADGR